MILCPGLLDELTEIPDPSVFGKLKGGILPGCNISG